MGGVTRRSGVGGPPGWITLGAMALVVAATAAFGGLAPAEARVTSVAEDTTYVGKHLDVTVASASVVDTVEAEYLEPDPGFRVLLVRMSVTNHLDRAVGAVAGTPGLGGTLFADKKPVISPDVETDGSEPEVWYPGGDGYSPSFQPGIPTDFEVAWFVPADAVQDGDEIAIEVRDFAVQRGQIIVSAESRRFKVGDVAAALSVRVSDDGVTP